MEHYYLGRQPIFDNALNVIGYELLFRPHDTQRTVFDGDRATSQVLVNTFWELGLAKVVGKHQAFINLTRNFVLTDGILPPPSRQLVLEILEDIVVDEELIAAVRALRNKGYIIALDDFIYHHKLRPLVELADIVKIDVHALAGEETTKHVTLLRKFPLKLLAEKVETPEEFDWCKGLGFDYYQGFFLCRPRIIKGRRLPASRMSTMRIMAQLQDPEIAVKELETIISHDVTMSYRLLRYINSAAFSLPREIDSIRHAIVYLGAREIRNWASLIALSSIDDKPDELLLTALTRGKMCELLTQQTGQGSKDTGFIVGLFSALDAMMDSPMEELLDSLPLAAEINDALLAKTGPYGEALAATLAYEQGDWDEISCPGLSQQALSEAYLQSIEWAETTMRSLHD